MSFLQIINYSMFSKTYLVAGKIKKKKDVVYEPSNNS